MPGDLFEDQSVLFDERSNLRTSEQKDSSWILPCVGFVNISSREEARRQTLKALESISQTLWVCLQINHWTSMICLGGQHAIKLQLDMRRSTRSFSSWIRVSSHTDSDTVVISNLLRTLSKWKTSFLFKAAAAQVTEFLKLLLTSPPQLHLLRQMVLRTEAKWTIWRDV